MQQSTKGTEDTARVEEDPDRNCSKSGTGWNFGKMAVTYMVFDSAGGESDSTYRRQDFLDGLCDGCRSCSFFLAGLPFHVPEKSRDCR